MSKPALSLVCLGCGCLCDDVEATRDEGTITAPNLTCDRGQRWLDTALASRPRSATIQGQPADLDQALDQIADFMANCVRPELRGISACSTETQQAALALADQLGARLELDLDPVHVAFLRAAAQVGSVTCTLGEARNRADLLLCWRTDLGRTHPRLLERLGPKTIVAVDDALPTPKPDVLIHVGPGRDFDVVWRLRAVLRRHREDEALASLANQLSSCRFGVLLVGDRVPADAQLFEGLLALIHDLNRVTRFAVLPLLGAGNRAGAVQVCTWQTGYPCAVDWADGSPQPTIVSDAADLLIEILANRIEARHGVERVCVPTRTAGLEEEGTYFRMDDVPLHVSSTPLEAPMELPSSRMILDGLLDRARR